MRRSHSLFARVAKKRVRVPQLDTVDVETTDRGRQHTLSTLYLHDRHQIAMLRARPCHGSLV